MSRNKFYTIMKIIVFELFIILYSAVSIKFTIQSNEPVFLLLLCLIGVITFLTPNFILRYLMCLFMMLGNLLGVYLCETNSLWLSELAVKSYPAGSFPLLVIGWSLFLTTLYIFDNLFSLEPSNVIINSFDFKLGKYLINLKSIIPIATFVLNIVLLCQLIPHPFFLEKLDRFKYFETYLIGLRGKEYNWLSTSIPMCLALMFTYRTVLLYLNIIIYFIILFMTGEKFGGYWNTVVFFSIIFSIYNDGKDNRETYKLIAKLFVIFFFILGILFFHRTLNYGRSTLQSQKTYFIQRIAQQGQLWWRTYSLFKEEDYKKNNLQDEYKTFFQLDDRNEKKFNHAIYKIMRYTTPSNIFNQKVSSGSRYSTSTFASMYFYFKENGVVIYGIAGAIVYWLIMRSFIYSVRHLYFPELYATTRLLMNSYNAMTQSEFNLLFSYRTLSYIILFIIFYLIRKQIYKSCKREYHAITK